MIFARLLSSIGPSELPIGPFEFVRIMGKSLQSPDGLELAMYQAGMWVASGICYITLQADCPVQLEFSHTEFPDVEQFGPYAALRIVDGSAWPGKPPELIARFDDAVGAWHIYARPAAALNVLTIRRADSA
jgi:hypothetical protein